MTAASITKCHVTPPKLTYREIVDGLLSFAKTLPRRCVHQKPAGRKAIALPPSVQLPLFDFVGRTDANRKIEEDAKLTSFTKEKPGIRRKITNSTLNREVYIKEWELEATKRNMALDVTHYLQDCTHEKELDLLDARLEAAAKEISDYNVENKMDEQMQLWDAKLTKAALDIGRCIEKEEKDKEYQKQIIEFGGAPLGSNG